MQPSWQANLLTQNLCCDVMSCDECMHGYKLLKHFTCAYQEARLVAQLGPYCRRRQTPGHCVCRSLQTTLSEATTLLLGWGQMLCLPRLPKHLVSPARPAQMVRALLMCLT